jgi:hypothetical protein
MKTSKFSDSQIMAILKQGESGVPVAALSHSTQDAWLHLCLAANTLSAISPWAG